MEHVVDLYSASSVVEIRKTTWSRPTVIEATDIY
jgi:hypothetical protein